MITNDRKKQNATKVKSKCNEFITKQSIISEIHTHIPGDMCSPTWETHIPSDMCSPTWETHIPSDMCSPTWETHIPSDMCSPNWETHIPSH